MFSGMQAAAPPSPSSVPRPSAFQGQAVAAPEIGGEAKRRKSEDIPRGFAIASSETCPASPMVRFLILSPAVYFVSSPSRICLALSIPVTSPLCMQTHSLLRPRLCGLPKEKDGFDALQSKTLPCAFVSETAMPMVHLPISRVRLLCRATCCHTPCLCRFAWRGRKWPTRPGCPCRCLCTCSRPSSRRPTPLLPVRMSQSHLPCW